MPPTVVSLTPGERLGPYEVTTQIGVGGMGEVYRATDRNLKRQVAIKVLPESVAGDGQRLARFQREAEALAALNHPNIAVIYGLERANDRTALVMELIEGPTLAARIAQGPISAEEAVSVAKQIAEALEAAHAQGIIHRDLKPANLKVRSDGTVKVLDFGLAKAIEPAGATPPNLSQSPTITTPTITQRGVILGTAAYMSPEQARGKSVDKRTDIWAFGCVLYEMLSGHRAFGGEDVTDTLAAVVKSEPNWGLLPAGVSPSVALCVRTCLRKDPRQRLHDIADARLALEGAFDTNTFTAHQGVTPVSSWRRVAAAAAGGAVAALALGLAGMSIWWDRSDSTPVATTRFAVTFNPGQRLGGMPSLALSADGHTLIFRATGADGVYRLHRRSIGHFDVVPIGGTEGAGNPSPSPDGRWLAFTSGSTLKRVSLSGGPSEVVAELPSEVRGVNWETSDSMLLGAGERGVLRVSTRGGDPVPVAAPAKGRELWFPQALPGRRAVLVSESTRTESTTREVPSEIQLLDLETGRRRALLQGSEGRFVPTGHIVFVRGGTLWAVGFDPNVLEITGTPSPVIEGIRGNGAVALGDTGSLAYVPASSEPPRRLVWVDRTGREEVITAPPGGYTYPRLSPDGSRVAIDVRAEEIDIWVWDLRRHALTRLTFDPAQDEYPVWTPDSQGIIYASYRDGTWGVFLQAADGTGVARRVGKGASEIDPFSLAPDGRRLVLGSPTAGDLVTLDLGGSDEVAPLLTQSSAEWNGEISPNGRWVAYQSNASGRNEVYVRPFPAADRGLWQVSRGGGTHPLWARNGRELFYLSEDGLMSVTVEPGSSFMFGTPSLVLKGAMETYWLSTAGRAFDVASDGQRFLMLKADERTIAEIRVVLHWFEELKRLVPTD